MECIDIDEQDQSKAKPKNPIDCEESTENFQKCIFELFEKNGILNDLRAYLRGHIVTVLKSANTGEPNSCQKHFTQRLELTYQALNILITEYLLRLEFSYTLSVFISEIPLANMLFEFAKTLFKTADTSDISQVFFRENDVWSILNCLGMRCDSEHACKIVQMYTSEDKMPLLLCIMKCIPMYRKESLGMDDATSEEYLTSDRSTDTVDGNYKKMDRRSRKCRHYTVCKSCQSREIRLKEKYSRRKAYIVQSTQKSSLNSLDVGAFMKNLTVIEQGIINEMFQQLKAVYETEVEMVKEEEENKIKKSIASHALQLEKQREELEESYREREMELHRSIEDKKKFLWGLAKSLRQQHENMTKAMEDVKIETERLSAKENNLKTQIQEAEELLRRRGVEMREQISNELQILDQHLQSMKRERDSINIERTELENLRSNKEINNNKTDETDVKRHYDVLKDELQDLKKYLAAASFGANSGSNMAPNVAKCMVDRGTLTEACANNLLNNEHAIIRGDRVVTDKVNNDLGGRKNVNFNMSKEGIYNELQRKSRSSISSDDGAQSDRDHETCDHDLYDRDGVVCDRGHGHRDCNYRSAFSEVQRLRDENERLSIMARQQSDHIASLSSERSQLQSQLIHTRPQTAPNLMQPFAATRLNQSASNAFVSTIGGGEQLNMFPEARPRVLIPSDALPFIGVLRDRHTDSRRHLINQWRSLRRRASPRVAGPRGGVPSDSPRQQSDANASATGHKPLTSPHIDNERKLLFPHSGEQSKKQAVFEANKSREKSPKSVLREAKEKLRNKGNIKECTPITREKSPNTTLREAKLRLRKLEIEAEAVERSYQHFRRRQRGERNAADSIRGGTEELGVQQSKSLQKLEHSNKIEDVKFNLQENQDLIKRDFDKYLKEYQTKFNIPPFKNKNAMSEMIKPIPVAFSEVEDKRNRNGVDFLETPISEFRKLYHIDKPRQTNITTTKASPINFFDNNLSSDQLKEAERNILCNDKKKKAELKILQDNINKMYSLDSPNMIMPALQSTKRPASKIETVENILIENNEVIINEDAKEKNLLQVKIENVCETKSVPLTAKNDHTLLVVVESAIDTKEIASEPDIDEQNQISTQMTIIVSPKHKTDKPTKPEIEKLTNNDIFSLTHKTDKPTKTEIEKLTNNDIFSPTHKTDTPTKTEIEKLTNNDIFSPKHKTDKPSKTEIEKLTNNDILDAIFQAKAKKDVSSVDMQLELSNIDSPGDNEYPDDFSADVDNYNSRSENEQNSPLSLAKDSEDDFWET